VALSQGLAQDHGLSLVPVPLVELDRAEIAAEVRVGGDEVCTAPARPFFDRREQSSSDTVTTVVALNRQPGQVCTPPTDVELRLDIGVRHRLLQQRLCVADRLSVELRDEPQAALRKRLLDRASEPFDRSLEVRNVKSLRLDPCLLGGQVVRGARKTFRILEPRRS
jgi:hypothetical protein